MTSFNDMNQVRTPAGIQQGPIDSGTATQVLYQGHPAMSRFQHKLGFIIAGCGSLLALFAFFSLPYYVTPSPYVTLLSYTGQQLASRDGYGTYWLYPIIAAVIFVIVGWQMLLKWHDAAMEVMGIIYLLIFALFILLIAPVPQNDLAVRFVYGSGFWVFAVAMIVVVVGDIVQIKEEWS